MGTPLTELLRPDTVLVTAGQRLARHLLYAHARSELENGKQVWETPDVLTWQAWLERLWREASEANTIPELLLTPAQELALWERLIRERQEGESLLQPAAAARLASEAWELVQTWHLPLTDAELISEEAQAFRYWATRYEGLCREYGWIDGARLPDRLAALVAERRLPLPARVVFVEFDELTPQQRLLIDNLRAVGCAVETVNTPIRPVQAQCLALPTATDEILAAAQWARIRLLANPKARIAVIVPDLTSHRAAIGRALEDVLIPQAVLPEHLGIERPFNFSLGLPLLEYPLVQSALRILDLGSQSHAQGRFDVEDASSLLRSPFIGEAEIEQSHRALLDARMRESREPFVTLKYLRQLAQATAADGKATAHACQHLARRLGEWWSLLDKLLRTQTPGRWTAVFAEQLNNLGWPGERTLNSHEYQTYETWRELLSNFSGLDTVLPALTYDEALRQLRRLAQDRLFQPKTPEVPVQVLGVLEASGLEFDHVWVMGLDDEKWPPAASPNPLLPIYLQRRLGLPHASPERELEFARRVTARLLVSGREVVVSHAQADGDRVLHPSPLIADLPKVERATLLSETAPLYRESIRSSGALEIAGDTQAPPLSPGKTAGGTGILQRQSDCPFRAFAEYRLHANAPQAPEVGLGPAERGILVHRALEAVWKTLGTHERLAQLADAKLQKVIAAAVGEAIASSARRRPFTFTRRFTTIERERLERLVQEWLALERDRAPFAVLGSEPQRHLRVADLEIDARMDRVDRLADGTLAVMDYKTGDPKVRDWFGERPKEPQLPLYSLYGVAADEVGAIVYARVKRGACGFHGLSQGADALPGVEALADSKQAAEHGSWAQLQQRWRQTLERLARQFGEGDAAVDPRESQTCRQCSFHPLCRIHEVRERAGRLTLEDADD